jgi:hypothetical protein
MVLISTSASWIADLVNSLVSVGLSQCGWCLLKLPNHNVICIFALVLLLWFVLGVCDCVNVSSWWIVLFLLQSLYILYIVASPPLTGELDDCHVP